MKKDTCRRMHQIVKFAFGSCDFPYVSAKRGIWVVLSKCDTQDSPSQVFGLKHVAVWNLPYQNARLIMTLSHLRCNVFSSRTVAEASWRSYCHHSVRYEIIQPCLMLNFTWGASNALLFTALARPFGHLTRGCWKWMEAA